MNCIICSSTNIESIFQSQHSITSDRRFQNYPIDSCICNACGAAFNLSGSRANPLQFYAESYELHSENAKSEFMIHSSSPIGESEAILNFINDNIPLQDSGSMLEVGCGKGILLSKFMKLKPNWKVSALEPSANAANYFRALLPEVLFYEGIFSDSPFYRQKFDFIATSGVLEHVPNPYSFLEEIRNALDDDGYAYIGVPNFSIKPDDVLVFDHLTNFTPTSLDNLYSRVGFELVQRDSRDDRIWLWDAVRKCEPKIDFKYDPANEIRAAKSHVETVKQSLASFQKMLRFLEDNSSKGAIFGMGVLGLYAEALWDSENQLINYILEDNPGSWGSNKLGLKVCNPSEWRNLNIDAIFIGANPCYHNKIKEKLLHLGFKEDQIYF